MITNQLRKNFQRFAETGAYCTPPGRMACALHSAKTLEQWELYESAGLVRLIAEPEQESYFDVYGKPDTEKERQEIIRYLDLWGCFCIISQVWIDGKWEHADSVGMCVYARPLDPFDNTHVIDLMASALRQVPQPGEVDSVTV